MKHLYVTLDYSRFEVIPTGVTRTKLISETCWFILSYPNQYGYFNVHNFFLYECLHVDVEVHYHVKNTRL